MGSNHTEMLAAACESVLPTQRLSRLYVFDFDECLVDTHISRCMSAECHRRLIEVGEERPDPVYGVTRHDVSKLSAAWLGATREEIMEIAEQVCRMASWWLGAEALLRRIAADPDRAAVIAGSGMELAIRTWLGQYSLAVVVLSTELCFDAIGVCRAPGIVVSDEAKAQLIRMAKACWRFGKVIAIGHSKGDLPMLETADISVALKDDTDVEAQCHYVLKDFSEMDVLTL